MSHVVGSKFRRELWTIRGWSSGWKYETFLIQMYWADTLNWRVFSYAPGEHDDILLWPYGSHRMHLWITIELLNHPCCYPCLIWYCVSFQNFRACEFSVAKTFALIHTGRGGGCTGACFPRHRCFRKGVEQCQSTLVSVFFSLETCLRLHPWTKKCENVLTMFRCAFTKRYAETFYYLSPLIQRSTQSNTPGCKMRRKR